MIGLTGGIGSGKSTVAALLEARGAHVIDTDIIAREVSAPGSPVLDAIQYEFGEVVIAPDGSLKRDALAAIVFSDPRRRERLNELTHPAIVARTLELVAQQPAGAKVVVVVPLLFESGFDKRCDATIAVVADPASRRTRVASRDAVSEEHVAARMNAQLADEEYERRADHVLHNDGSLAELGRAVDAVWDRLETA